MEATPSTWNVRPCGAFVFTFHLKFWAKLALQRWSKIADFLFIFARSASAVTPSEKSSSNTNRKSTTRFPMSLRWSSYFARTPPKRGSKTQTVQNCATTPKQYEIGCQLLLITIRKSHTGFLLVPTSMALNDPEQRNCPYFAFFSPNSIALQADYVTVVEVTHIMSVKYYLPVPVFYFWHKLTHPAVRSLCDSWTTCFYNPAMSWLREI